MLGIWTTNPINKLHIYNSNINFSISILSIQDASVYLLTFPPDIASTQTFFISMFKRGSNGSRENGSLSGIKSGNQDQTTPNGLNSIVIKI